MPCEENKIGVLALQGAFVAHANMLRQLDAEPVLVRYREELDSCKGLILPGGESTTLNTLMKKKGLDEAIVQFAKTRPLFGTCAGLIVMSQMGLLEIEVKRNGYGRQIDSFSTAIMLERERHFPGIFIRAPMIIRTDPSVQVLATHENHPILVRSGLHLACTFHPELTKDPTIHELWMNQAFTGCYV